jgi:hypothetical protein
MNPSTDIDMYSTVLLKFPILSVRTTVCDEGHRGSGPVLVSSISMAISMVSATTTLPAPKPSWMSTPNAGGA